MLIKDICFFMFFVMKTDHFKKLKLSFVLKLCFRESERERKTLKRCSFVHYKKK